LNEASNIAIRDHISKMEPNEVLDFAAKEIPDLKEIAEIGKTDPEFAQAFKGMLTQDINALSDIRATLNEDGSKTTLQALKALVQNPETRGHLTLEMQKVAENEDYSFADMKDNLLKNAQVGSLQEFFKDILANPNMFLSKMETLFGPNSMVMDFLKPAMAVFHGVASLMREGLTDYAQLGPGIVKGSEDYLAKQGNTWTTYTPGV
jgi:hypothetical protein